MNSLFLSPHNDDAVLFGAFTLLREQPHVITVLRSEVQETMGIDMLEREVEDDAAFEILGVEHEQWEISDREPDWVLITDMLSDLDRVRLETIDRVYAPAVELDGGHEHHNALGQVALDVFGVDRVTHYLTYTRQGGKSTWGTEVAHERSWVRLKLQALACYRSQIESELAGCTAHFLRDQREYYA